MNSKNNCPLISIIVPVYKVEKYLNDCVSSIVRQTYTNLEIILIDDGSPDSCPQLCDEWASKDSRIKVVHKKNGGQSSARNLGLDLMTGKLCMFVDSDDFIHLKAIEISYHIMQEYEADIVEFSSIKTATRELPEPYSEFGKITLFDNHSIFTSAEETVVVWRKLYKSALWNKIRFPQMKENEDDATAWKLYYSANRIVKTDLPLYLYYINEAGITVAQSKAPHIECPIKAYNERITYFENIDEPLLSTISKWRFVKSIVLSFKRGNLTSEQKAILFNEYNEYYLPVLMCKYVPFKQKVLFFIFRFNTKIAKFAIQRY